MQRTRPEWRLAADLGVGRTLSEEDCGRPRWLARLALAFSLSALHCSGAPQVLYHNKLESLEGLLTRDGVTLETQAWQGRAGIRIEAHGPTSVRLAEVQTTGAEVVVLTYRGHLRATKLTGRAYLEMRAAFPARGS